MIALAVAAFTALYQVAFDRASSLGEESLTLSTEMDFPLAIAHSKELFGLGAYVRGKLVEAMALHQEALTIFRKIDKKRNIAHILVNLARTAYSHGDFTGATRFLEESLSISCQLDIRWSLAFSLEILGVLQRSSGNYERAYELFQQSLSLCATGKLTGHRKLSWSYRGLANIIGQPIRSARLFAAADKLRETRALGQLCLGQVERFAATLEPLAEIN